MGLGGNGGEGRELQERWPTVVSKSLLTPFLLWSNFKFQLKRVPPNEGIPSAELTKLHSLLVFLVLFS